MFTDLLQGLYLSDQRTSRCIGDEDFLFQALVIWPVGAWRLAAADPWVLQTEQTHCEMECEASHSYPTSSASLTSLPATPDYS